eukprot:m.266748 g.266748  ORF g.266748 m.266748 type:complete len:1010 (-) comp15632_c1_seq8:429-3458(-)
MLGKDLASVLLFQDDITEQQREFVSMILNDEVEDIAVFTNVNVSLKLIDDNAWNLGDEALTVATDPRPTSAHGSRPSSRQGSRPTSSQGSRPASCPPRQPSPLHHIIAQGVAQHEGAVALLQEYVLLLKQLTPEDQTTSDQNPLRYMLIFPSMYCATVMSELNPLTHTVKVTFGDYTIKLTTSENDQSEPITTVDTRPPPPSTVATADQLYSSLRKAYLRTKRLKRVSTGSRPISSRFDRLYSLVQRGDTSRVSKKRSFPEEPKLTAAPTPSTLIKPSPRSPSPTSPQRSSATSSSPLAKQQTFLKVREDKGPTESSTSPTKQDKDPAEPFDGINGGEESDETMVVLQTVSSLGSLQGRRSSFDLLAGLPSLQASQADESGEEASVSVPATAQSQPKGDQVVCKTEAMPDVSLVSRSAVEEPSAAQETTPMRQKQKPRRLSYLGREAEAQNSVVTDAPTTPMRRLTQDSASLEGDSRNVFQWDTVDEEHEGDVPDVPPATEAQAEPASPASPTSEPDSAGQQSEGMSPLNRQMAKRRDRRDGDASPSASSTPTQMILKFSHGQMMLMSGSHKNLLDYLTLPHVSGLLYQSSTGKASMFPKEGTDDVLKALSGSNSPSVFEQSMTSAWFGKQVTGHPIRTETSDKSYQSTFLLTFRLFMSPQQLMSALLQRFDIPDDDADTELDEAKSVPQRHQKAQTKVLRVIYEWVTRFWHDFALDQALVERLVDFLNFAAACGYDRYCDQCEASILEQQDLWEECANGPFDHIPTRTAYAPVSSVILHLDSQVIAEQLTLLNDTLMRQILPVEYVNHVRYKKEMHPNEYDTFSRNLQRFIQRFNLETNWVTNEILAAESQKNQTTLIDKFVKVACHCLDLNNFYSLFAVMGGVTTSKVQKLPAWKALSKKTKKVVAKMEETILNPTGNMRGYRLLYAQRMEEMHALIPFLPILLKDLLFWDEGNSDEVDRMINFDKLRTLSDHVQDIWNLSTRTYPFEQDPGILAYLVVASQPPNDT